MVDGEFVMRDGRFTRVDLDEIRREVEEKFQALLERKAQKEKERA